MADYVFPADRIVQWIPGDTVGVTGGIPEDRVNIVDVTLAPYFADKTGVANASDAINSAISAAPAESVIYLPAGTYRCNGSIYPASNKTIRGAGLGSTIIDSRANIGIAYAGDGSWSNVYNARSNISSGATAGSTTVVLSTPGGGLSPFVVGQIARLTCPENNVLPVVSTYGFSGIRYMTVKITAIVGSSLSFYPPIPPNFAPAGTWSIIQAAVAPKTGIGIEALTVTGVNSSGVMLTGVQVGLLTESWVNEVSVVGHNNYGVMIFDSVNCEIAKTVIAPSGLGTNHAGFLPGSCTGLFLHNNIATDNFPCLEMNSCCVYNAVAYNLFLADGATFTNHAPHNSYNLFEGNITNNIKSDGYFGGSSEETFLRNWITGVNFAGDAAWTVALNRLTRKATLVANLLQTEGETYASGAISTGNPNIGNGSFTGTAQPSVGDWWIDLLPDGTTPYIGSLTTRSSDTSGVVTLTSGTIGNLTGGTYSFIVLKDSTPGVINSIYRGTFNIVGSTLVVDTSAFGGGLPPLSTPLACWAGPPGFQELDLDVLATTIQVANNTVFDEGIPADQETTDTIPDSLLYDVEPSWWPDTFTWPPFDPYAPNRDIEAIPAGYYYVNGSWPDDVPAPPTATASIPALGATLVLSLNKICTAGAGGTGGITLSASGGAVTATYVSGVGLSTWTYSLSRTILQSESVTWSYSTADGIQSDGLDLAPVVAASVTNNSTQVPSTTTPTTPVGGRNKVKKNRR